MTLQSALLALLTDGPKTGYGLGRMLHSESPIWEAKLQHIYRTLARLEEERLVEAELVAQTNRPNKKVFSITPRGEAELGAWLASPSRRVSRDSLLVQLYCFSRASIQAIVRSLEERHAESSASIEALQGALADMQGHGQPDLGRLLVCEALLTRAQAEASWSERALMLLAGSDRSPAADSRSGRRTVGKSDGAPQR